MIVADSNVIAYLYLPGKLSALSEQLLLRDSQWAVPRLWRSEVQNILATYMKQKLLTLDDALTIFDRAVALVSGNEYDVAAAQVLRLAKASGCSAYDCEFVALAQHLQVPLVSADARLCKAFPDCTLALTAA